MTNKQKRSLIYGVTLLTAIATAAILVPKLLKKDLRAELAKVLNEDPKQFVLNVPPAGGLAPGSVFIKDHLRLIPLKRTPRNDDGITQGAVFELGWAQLADATGKGSVGTGSLGALFGDTESANIEVRAKNCRILDMDLDKIRERLKSTDLMDLAADKTKQITVVVRAYEGVLETKISRKSKTNAEAWKEVQEKAESTSSVTSGAGNAAVEVKSNTDDEILLTWKEPVIFACSVQSVTYFASHLGPKAEGVDLQPLQGENLSLAPQALDVGPPTSLRATEEPWALLTIASGHYPKNNTLRQDWNAVSAEVFESSLKPWKPVFSERLWAADADPLDRNRVLASVGDFFPAPGPPGLNGR
jgi:hypothetical protein